MNMEINPSEYKILIVDDVMSNVLLLKVLLTNEKFAIATANNGRQALEQVDKERPDLLLLDVMMPDLSGFEVAQRLKSKSRYSGYSKSSFDSVEQYDGYSERFSGGCQRLYLQTFQ